jgi:hypothetical protein
MKYSLFRKMMIGVCFLASSAPHLAHAERFALNKSTVNIDAPSTWQNVQNLFGMPLMFLGPTSAGGRPVLSVTATGQHGLIFDTTSLRRNEAEYRTGRETWLAKYKGEALSFTPYHLEKLPGGLEAQTIGYRYRLNGVVFAETTYLIVCKEQLFHLKSLLRAPQGRLPSSQTSQNETARAIQGMLNSFTCE